MIAITWIRDTFKLGGEWGIDIAAFGMTVFGLSANFNWREVVVMVLGRGISIDWRRQ